MKHNILEQVYLGGVRMKMYENKTIEELIDFLIERDELIVELKQEVETITDDYNETTAETNEMYSDSMDKSEQEELAEKSFYAGRDSNLNSTPLKAWLNYKIGERL